MNEFRIVAMNGKFVGRWENLSDFTVGMMEDIRNVCNTLYGKNWKIEYK